MARAASRSRPAPEPALDDGAAGWEGSPEAAGVTEMPGTSRVT